MKLIPAFFCTLLISSGSFAFDVMNEKLSYVDSKYITLGTGLGFTGFSKQKGISGDEGFGFRVSAGHHFTPYLDAEFLYQFSTFEFESPDPVFAATPLRTRAGMNQEVFRFNLSYPAVLLQPYLTAGVGGYSWFGVDSETALSFPINLVFPVGAGIRAYTYKNIVSFNLEFNYQILMGENQDADTLRLLGLNKLSFDMYSVMATFLFHFW